MPYSIENLQDLPENVQVLSEDKQKIWINIFNSAYKACQEKENPPEECEASAFAQANGAIKDEDSKGIMTLKDVPETYTEDGERNTYMGAYNIFYKNCMDGASDDKGSGCRDGAHSAGQSAVRKKRKKKAAGDYSDSCMIAFYLPEDVTSQITLGVPGAIPSDQLHMTLCYLCKATDLTEKQVDDIKRAVSLWAKQQVPVDVRINGLARFTKMTSEGEQPLVALLDSRHLKSLQYSLESYVKYDGGFDYDSDHTFMPHVTLGYLPQGALWPIQNLPELKFSLKSVVFKVGEMRYDLELTGEMSEGLTPLDMPVPVLKAGARNSSRDLDDIQTIHDKAYALGAKCGDMDEGKALNFALTHYGLPSDKKALDLERQSYQVRQAWYAQFCPPNPHADPYEIGPAKFWIQMAFPDYVVVEHAESGKLYKYDYTMSDGVVVFQDPVQVEIEFDTVVQNGKSIPQAPEKVQVRTFWTCGVEEHEHDSPEGARKCISVTTLNTPHVRSEFVKSVHSNNCLKTVQKTDDELVVANYIVLFGGRDLEGIASPRVNPDGSIGEYFTKNTALNSDYTATGQLLIDWEHRSAPDPQGPDQEDIFGYVDWKSAIVDDTGVFVNRVLNRRNKYVKMLEALFDAGIIGSSTEPVQKGVVKGHDGEIQEWPLKRDSFSVSPMDPRMLGENHLEIVKSLRDTPEGVNVYQAVFHNEVAVAEAAAISLISQIGVTSG